MKLLILIMLAAIIASLGSALMYLGKDKGAGKRTVRALTFRIGLSVVLFVMLMVFYALGWIQPTGPRPY